jgi:glycolate oxidase FAD binding subunit
LDIFRRIISLNTITLDDFGPLNVIQPDSVSTLVDLVRRARQENQAIYPLGGRTTLHLGLPPNKAGFAIDLTRLNQVIDYPARDMTITVQAGITINELQWTLEKENQWLPIDVSLPANATLGGAIATNGSGPRRYSQGTFRDYIIGITVINDHGEEVKAGGRVVKNVAGYDMMKLFTGSLGTLGIISQVTLKVKPKPESSRMMVFFCPNSELDRLTGIFQSTKTRPSAIEYVNHLASSQWNTPPGKKLFPSLSDGACNVVVVFEENAQAVDWQMDQFRKELPLELKHSLREYSGSEAESIWSFLRDFPLLGDSVFRFKASLLPSRVSDYCRMIDRLKRKIAYQSHPGNGIVIGSCHEKLSLESSKELAQTLLNESTTDGGNLVITHCSSEWKKQLPIWGKPTPDRMLMKSVKDHLDPGRLFNPGRFID